MNPLIQAGEILYTSLQSPLGSVWVARSRRGVFCISIRSRTREEFVAGLGRMLKGAGLAAREAPSALKDETRQLSEYFRGARRSFSLPVDLSSVTRFQRRALEAAAAIPFGQVASYADLARAIGRPGASRAVGQAMGRNPTPIIIPCHRVIASGGKLGGFTGGSPLKRKLLQIEEGAGALL